MGDGFALLVTVVLLAVVFDYINGFHDTANAIATVVSTNVLPARTAIIMAAMVNFLGALAGTGVAKTIGADIASPSSITQTVVVCALASAVIWNLVTWYFGLPSSSSHALVGGIVGAVLCHQVVERHEEFLATLTTLVNSPGLWIIVKFLFLSPLLGLATGFIIMILLLYAVRRTPPTRVNKSFRRLQLVSATAMAFSHGSNDAQKSMGIITMALVCYYTPMDVKPGWLHFGGKEMFIPYWVIIVCATAMALGTAAGGWRVMKTMGQKIIKLKPINGFAAESSGALVISLATHVFHAPVSTTHVISSSIMGVGASRRVSAVRWGIAGNIVVAWVLTIPVAALVAACLYYCLRPVLGA